MYTDHEVRRIMEDWDAFRNPLRVTDSFLSTIDIERVINKLHNKDKEIATYICSGYTSSEIAFFMKKSIRTIQRMKKSTIRQITRNLNGE